MWIRNFDLDDFGCFNRARLLDLEDGLTVIGGPQRAGKTTFMLAMRKLGYGISRGDELPPANEEYRLAADIVHDGTECDISVNGYADPRLFSEDGSVALEDIYGSVTADQYRQLFTISLDQLRRTPPGLSDRKELSAILLGAGYGDIAQIPEIKSDLRSDASDIGGKHGRGVYEMKNPVEQIESGIDARREANSQVDTHRERLEDLEEVEGDLEELSAQEAELERREDRLRTLDSHYQDLERYRQLDRELDDDDRERVASFPLDSLERARELAGDYGAAVSERDEQLDEFRQVADVEDLVAHQDALLDRADEIRRFEREISGWQAEINTLEEREADLSEDWDELAAEAGKLESDWEEDPEQALDIPIDSLTADSVNQVAEAYSEAYRRLEDKRRELEQNQEELGTVETQLEDLDATEGGPDGAHRVVITFLLIAGLGVVAGLLVGVGVTPIYGLAVAAVVVGIAMAYAYVRLLWGDGIGGESPKAELEANARRLESEIESVNGQIDRAEAERREAEEELDDLRDTLGLPDHVSANGVSSFYRDLEALQADIREAKREADAIEQRRQELRTRLAEVLESLEPVFEDRLADCDPLDDAEEVFEGIRRAVEELDVAEELETAQRSVDRLEESIQELLLDWTEIDSADEVEAAPKEALDRFIEAGGEVEALEQKLEKRDEIRSRLVSSLDRQVVWEAFEALLVEDDSTGESPTAIDDRPVEELLTTAMDLADEYVDEAAIEAELERIREELSDLDDRRDGLLSDRADLQSELESLASDDDLKEAQATIERGRQQLRPLAERYAQARIAEFLIDELHDRFIEEATGPLLEEATGLFERITAEYTDVNHTGSLDDLDFEAIRADGTVHASTELSRATREQLFLAVRIARIRQIDASLPVVLDDSMTNFDPPHLARTLELVSELAETNQVFFLTCHPTFVEAAAERAGVDQFRTLEDGRFDGPFEETGPVIESLSGQ